MTKIVHTFTKEYLERFVIYEPETGKFFWKEREGDKRFNSRYAGKEAGTRRYDSYKNPRCIHIHFDGRLLMAHRMAYVIHYGEELPLDIEVDHIDGDPFNNKIENLRKATRMQNGANTRKQCNNKSGYKGVRASGRKKNPWRAYICHNGVKYHLGCFPTEQEAHEAYRKKAVEFFGEFARFD